jgi:hypothetical protein
MSAAATGDVFLDDARRRWTLAKLVKSGGAGSVFLLKESPQLVAKLYHHDIDIATYDRKVAAMLKLSPDLPEIVDGMHRSVQIAWPTSSLHDRSGRFVGFLMPAVDVQATNELEVILQEKQARAAHLPTGLGAKVTLAANLSAVVAALHARGHYIVDLKPVNLRFHRSSLHMALLDCDGFSIQGNGERFPAPQFTPDYLAPEFQRSGITPHGEQAQDRFALAVVIFQLLNFGIHPFTGRPSASNVPTDIPGRIAGRWYAYGVRANAGIAPSPVSGHARMPSDLRAMFDRAFETNGLMRPAPGEWQALLESYARRSTGRMVMCSMDAAHQHYAGFACAQCDRLQVLRKARAAQPARAAQATQPTRAHARRPHARPTTRAQYPTQRYPTTPPPVRWPPPSVYTPAQRLPPTGSARRGFVARLLLGLTHRVAGAAFVVMTLLVLRTCGVIGDRDAPAQRTVVASAPRPAPATLPSRPSDDTPPLEAIVGDVDWIEAYASLAGEFDGNVDKYVEALRNQAIMSRPPSPATMQIFREALDEYARASTDHGLEWAARNELRKSLSEMQARDRRAGQVAFELGLVALIDGDHDLAMRSFLHAIAVAPADPSGWYGLAAAKATQAQDVYGALSIAEALARDEARSQALRVRLIGTLQSATAAAADLNPYLPKSEPATAPASDRDVRRFSIILARARLRVAKSTGADLPADIRALAAEPLPQ